MKAGPALAILVLAAYIGFEIYALHRAGPRMEPAAILERFTSAQQATARCGEPAATVRADFERNYGHVRRNALEDAAEAAPDEPDATVTARIDAQIRAAQTSTDELIDAKGCEDMEVWRLLQLYEKRARLNLG